MFKKDKGIDDNQIPSQIEKVGEVPRSNSDEEDNIPFAKLLKARSS